MTVLTLYTIPPLLSSVLFLSLGIFVCLKNKKSTVNITFGLICFVTFWWQFSWFILFNTLDEIIASYLVKIGYIGIIFIPVIFFHFIISFLKQVTKFDRYLLYFSYLMGFIFMVFLMTTNYFIKGFYKYFWGFYPKAGLLHPFYLLLLIFLALRIIYLLLLFLRKKKKLLPPNTYSQITYILWGVIFYTFASVDFAVNYGFEVYPFGFIFILIFLGTIATAIVKKQLFGIKIILTALLIVLIALLLFLDLLIFTPQPLFRLVKGVISIIFLYFGYLLIKSVLREIKMREEIERLSKAKSEFISIASHQLRTPLTAIKGYISMILEGTYGKLAERAQKPMENIYKSNERLIKLVNDLLSISRIESGKMEMEWKRASLEDIIKSIIDELKIEAEKKKIKLVWQIPKEPLPKILIDLDKIRQVIANVVDNAIRYTQQGKVTVSAKLVTANHPKRNKIVIKVEDTGEGMTKEEISYLFESFSRGKAGSRFWAEGAGLGLYIARRFVELHNGKIWAESPGKGKGSTFYIELPLSR